MLIDPQTREPVKDTALDMLYDAMIKARSHAEAIAKLPGQILGNKVFSHQTNTGKLRRETMRLAALRSDCSRMRH